MLMKVKDAIIRLKIKLFYQSEREKQFALCKSREPVVVIFKTIFSFFYFSIKAIRTSSHWH